jgi:hypothetical protein
MLFFNLSPDVKNWHVLQDECWDNGVVKEEQNDEALVGEHRVCTDRLVCIEYYSLAFIWLSGKVWICVCQIQVSLDCQCS